eukprot:Hpha_TRINITY_DN15008_c2_g21::TRINITY_DN15008_c2_g21_i1::g.123942::m.123942
MTSSPKKKRRVDGAGAAAEPAQTSAPTEDERLCRYCFCPEDKEEEGGELVRPCTCKGGQEYCHLSCLRRWQRSVLVTQPTHPAFYERDERQHVCNVCKTEFSVPPPSRAELMTGFTGRELAALLEMGSIIASERNTSDRSAGTLAAHHPYIQRTLAHWVKGVYLITGVEDESASDESDLVIAVNLTRQMDLPAFLAAEVQAAIAPHTDKVTLRHFLSGPCAQTQCTAIGFLQATHIDEVAAHKVQVGGTQGGLWVVGELPNVVEIAVADLERRDGAKVLIKCCWGSARWSRTQLLGELARGHWGMCRAEAADVFPAEAIKTGPGAATEDPTELWESIETAGRLVYAPKSEMTEEADEDDRPSPTPEQRQEREEAERAAIHRLRQQMRSRHPEADPEGGSG